MNQIAQLHLSSVALSDDSDFALAHHLPEGALAFIRNGQGLVGYGEAVRLSARGPRRMQELADAWRTLVSRTVIDDLVQQTGSGLVAFGAFAFADDSSAESVLIVPKVLLGVRDGRRWITIVGTEPEIGRAHV